MTLSDNLRNRLGFILLGLTNNFAYVIMLSAAHDLLELSESIDQQQQQQQQPPATAATINATNNTAGLQEPKKYCNELSTSTILLADTIPSLSTKLIYPFLLVGLPVAYKASATALLTVAAFLTTGLCTDRVLIFAGVACASFSSGLGESTFVSNTPLYGDHSLIGWSIGTGAAGLLGSAAYALLRMVISIKIIMIIMLVVPVAMLVAYFYVIVPVDSVYSKNRATISRVQAAREAGGTGELVTTLSVISLRGADSKEQLDPARATSYGADSANSLSDKMPGSTGNKLVQDEDFDFRAKLNYLPSLTKYFFPLLLVYFAEYFINQGLFELIYYPEVSFLDKSAQYRWFNVAYQLGVMISRSSLDLVRIKNIWTMSTLQAVNAVLFLAHVSKLIHIPSFYLVIAIIVYEGLLGGFTYANTFYRMKKELTPSKHEFGVSTVTIADTLGIVMAGLLALPVHNALCKLYE